MNHAGIKSTARLFYLYSLFASLDFSRGIFLLFFGEKGISNTQLGILQTTLFLSGVLAELPAGVIADLMKRKYCVVAGMILMAVASFMYLGTNQFPFLVLLFAVQGAAFAFCSGADSALLYDRVRTNFHGTQETYLTISSRARNLATAGMAIAIVSGGWLSKQFGWSAVYIPVAVSMCLAAVFIGAIQEGTHVHPQGPPKLALTERLHSLKTGIAVFRSSANWKRFIAFVIGMGFVEAAHTPFFVYMQVYLKDRGLSEFMVGMIVASAMLCTSAAYFAVPRLASLNLKVLIATICIVVTGSLLLFGLQMPFALVVFFFCLINALPSLLFVFTDSHVNDLIPDSVRASLLSLKALITSLMICLSYLVMGRLMDQLTAKGALWLLGILPLIGTFVALWALNIGSNQVDKSAPTQDSQSEEAAI